MAEMHPSHLPLTESLKSLGLTKYEALVYVGLLKVSGATATDIHEISGVPRASVYPVLDRLIQKNLVSVSHTTPKRFEAVPPEDGIDHLLEMVESDAARAKKMLSRIYRDRSSKERGDQELIWSIYGDEHIRSRLIDLLQNAECSIDAVFFGGFLRDEIIATLCAKKNAATIRVVTDRWDGPIHDGISVCVKSPPESLKNLKAASIAGGVFLLDQKRAMVVMVCGEEGSTALFSESRGFVKFFSLYWEILSASGALPG
ncbi:MAG TPA: helix-turn-helix domain-containing protein [Methanolinea sp.]|nr:helix-turn-helix domain-containing protein [Methanolinea sp.]HQK55457.1 helix-turn-helix domain-containing protein [Methanolinea sp.]